MDPKVSVLLFTYNQKEFIREAIESVFEQSYDNWELIINDNGSEDGTQEIIKEYSGRNRVKLLLSDKNLPIQVQWNRSLTCLSGEFISILFGDDFYLPKKLNNQINAFKSVGNDWGVVHGPGFKLNQTSREKTLMNSTEASGFSLKILLEDFYTKGFVNVISPLIRKTCFEQYPMYEDLFTEGECIYLKFALSYKFKFLNEPLVVMREHEGNARWHSKKNIEILDICLDRLTNFNNFPKNCIKPLIKLRVENYNIGAWENVRLSRAMDSRWVRKRLFNAFKLDFLQIFFPRNIVNLIFTFFPKTLMNKVNHLIDLLLKKSGQPYFDDKFIED